MIFTPRHYSAVLVEGYTPRARLSDNATDAEKLKALEPFVANAGTYSRKDSLLTFRPLIAKNPNLSPGDSLIVTGRLRGDLLWIELKDRDGTVNTVKLVRVERIGTR